MSEKGILKKIDDIFNYCEEIDNHLPKEEQTGYSMLPDIFYIRKEVHNLQQKVEQLEKENFNIRENIHLERISLPPELTKDKNFMELYDIPSYEDLQQKVEQLEKENIKQKEIIENLTTMTVCGDKKQIKNTAQYKLEQLENIRKEAIEELTYMSTDAYVVDYDIREKHYNLLMNILNKGGISKYE